MNAGLLGVPDVAKARKGASKRKAIPRVMVTIRGTEAWRAWLGELAEFLRSRPTDVIDQALIKYAKEMGFDKEAPKR